MGEMIKNDDILSDNLYPGVIGRVSQTLSTMVPCPPSPSSFKTSYEKQEVNHKSSINSIEPPCSVSP